jgi:hypothetical protein
MAEQFLRAWSINQTDLYSVVGKKDEVLIKKVKENEDLTEEIDDLIQDWGEYSFGEALRDIIDGNLNEERSYEYLRTLEAILELNGESHEEEVTLPGRGWQDIGPLFSSWKLPTLQKLWSNKQLSFPWKSEEKIDLPDWPISMVLEKDMINNLKTELENFDPKLLKKYPLPERQEGLEEEVGFFIETMLMWLNDSKKDLILLLDGQQ